MTYSSTVGEKYRCFQVATPSTTCYHIYISYASVFILPIIVEEVFVLLWEANLFICALYSHLHPSSS